VPIIRIRSIFCTTTATEYNMNRIIGTPYHKRMQTMTVFERCTYNNTVNWTRYDMTQQRYSPEVSHESLQRLDHVHSRKLNQYGIHGATAWQSIVQLRQMTNSTAYHTHTHCLPWC